MKEILPGILNVKLSAQYFHEKTGISTRSFERYHRQKLPFRKIGKRTVWLDSKILVKYVDDLLTGKTQ